MVHEMRKDFAVLLGSLFLLVERAGKRALVFFLQSLNQAFT